ncbi:hypothetical protein EW145_g2680 [Phellinidium pouzarii]|uniref:Major facilitator superfamily (MFS) profile domain-containing protein n=1 Tax=Phellinidium pouzarii TaxID=167371 RepID=A0A4S4L9W7_9AGAM|nr:hypothetical protein EW145_g2680 [Phellinidium pouzarii]
MSSAEPDLVVFAKDDPEDAANWSDGKKRLVAAQLILVMNSVFGSSFYAATVLQLEATYGASDVVISLGLSDYVLGTFERDVWATTTLPDCMASAPASAPSAYVNNLAVIILFRFFAGCCAACALNNLYMTDMKAQAVAIAFYSAAVFAGPCVALPVGFFIAADAGPELWVLRTYLFFVAALLPVVYILPETHGPTILAKRSARYRKLGNPNARAAHELNHLTTRQFCQVHIGRPFAMFIREPIIQGAAVWTSLAYGIIYLFFEVYPFVFVQNFHFQLQFAGLPFISMVIGFITAILVNRPLAQLFIHMPFPSFLQPHDLHPNSPEARLKLALLPCFLMPVSLLWFAWPRSSGGNVHWIVPTLSGVVFGFAAITIFFIFLTYAAETFTIYSNSSSVSNSFCRSVIAAIFPLISNSLLNSLGVKWGVSLFAFLSLGLIPIPLIFLRYGTAFRKRSHYAQEAAALVSRMQGGDILMTERFPEIHERRELHSTTSLRTTASVSDEIDLSRGQSSVGIPIKSGGIGMDVPNELKRLDSSAELQKSSEFPCPPPDDSFPRV